MGAVDKIAGALNTHLNQYDSNGESRESGRIIALAIDQLFPYQATRTVIKQAWDYVEDCGECDECNRLAQPDDALCSTCAWKEEEDSE